MSKQCDIYLQLCGLDAEENSYHFNRNDVLGKYTSLLFIGNFISLIDTAQGYPGSESQVAEAIVDSGIPREEVFIMTKLHPRFLGYETTLEAIEMSLVSLKTDYIDLYLIHSRFCDDFLLTCEKGKCCSCGSVESFNKHRALIVKKALKSCEKIARGQDWSSRGITTNNKLNPHGTLSTGIEPVSQRWE